jgi:hypothetical protein
MEVVGDEKLYQIDTRIGQKLRIVNVDLFYAPSFGPVMGALPVGVAHGEDAGIFSPAITQGVQVRDPATAHQGDT